MLRHCGPPKTLLKPCIESTQKSNQYMANDRLAKDIFVKMFQAQNFSIGTFILCWFVPTNEFIVRCKNSCNQRKVLCLSNYLLRPAEALGVWLLLRAEKIYTNLCFLVTIYLCQICEFMQSQLPSVKNGSLEAVIVIRTLVSRRLDDWNFGLTITNHNTDLSEWGA